MDINVTWSDRDTNNLGASSMPGAHIMLAEQRPAQRLGGAFLTETDRSQETGEDHRDRLFVQVLLTLAVNILALILIFYLLLPLS